MPNPSATPTPITPPRVPLIDQRTGLIDRSWYMFFISMFNAATAVVDDVVGPNADSLIASYDAALRALADEVGTQPPAIDYTEDITNIKREGNIQPSAETGELQAQINDVRQELQVLPKPTLGTLSAVNIDWVPYLGFDTAPPWIGTTAGQFWYDSTTGSFNAKMGNNNITQQVGEEIFVYGKASATITDSPLQIIRKTGTVGASGVITFAPTVAGLTESDVIIGVATESLATNAFGRITAFGVVHGITTNGTAFGEVWADNDDIWYNPVTGNPTRTKPSAPGIKVRIGTVINAGSGGSGSFQVLLQPGSTLGGTDSNVQFGTLANYDLIQYDLTAGYWKNVAYTAVTVGTANNIAGGAANKIVYQTGAGATSFITAPTVDETYLKWTSAGGFAWASNPLGTVTSVSVVSANGFAGTVATATTTPAITLTTSITGLLYGNGTALAAATISAPLAYSAGTLSLASGYGDTQNPYAAKTANYVLAGPTSGASAVPTFRALVAADIPALPYQDATAPVTYTANFSVAATDAWIINNKSGSSCTATLPAASSYSGRVLHFQNYQAQTLVSASSNVIPLAGGAAGTSILLASSGDSATLVSNGSNWVMTQYVPNNILLLE